MTLALESIAFSTCPHRFPIIQRPIYKPAAIEAKLKKPSLKFLKSITKSKAEFLAAQKPAEKFVQRSNRAKEIVYVCQR
jgi:hypothetical protein